MSPQAMDEETLFAYLDGELDETQRARVEEAIANDPRLAAALAGQQRLKGQLHAHFDAVLDEPVPGHLLRMVQTAAAAPVADIGAAREARAARNARRWSMREWSAVAATLLLGLLVGLNLHRGAGGASLVAGNDGLRASGALASALSDQSAGPLPGAAGSQIGFSFRAGGGEYCRTFALASGESGLACRRGDRWAIDALAAGAKPASGGAFRLAASDMPDALRTAIEERMIGEPLTEAEERAQIARRWRSSK